jgi:hypothetical protein
MTTVLTSYSLVAELQHWFNHFVINSKINKYRVPPPVDIPELYLGENSFIDMLFNNSYGQNSYEYKYSAEQDPLSVPRVAATRLQVYPGSSQYLNLDSDGSNIFDLQADDFATLDALLAYRNDATSLTVVDSISVSFDATAIILYATLDNLSTELSKMIYLYLVLKLYDRFEEYNTETLISTGGLLQTCYESYLVDQYFYFMTQHQPGLLYECN